MLREHTLFPSSLRSARLLADFLHWMAKQVLLHIGSEFYWQPSELLSLIETDQNGFIHHDSLLRIINYYPESRDCHVSEAHEDLGLLTLILPSRNPCLEVYDFLYDSEWVFPEKQCQKNDIILLAGDSLAALSNGTRIACPHRVISSDSWRFSIVYQLRFKLDAHIDFQSFETEKTGQFHQTFKGLGSEFMDKQTQSRQSVHGSY